MSEELDSSLLQDQFYDQIGRALEAYPENNAVYSTCPTPRSGSPWPFPPQLTSLSSASTLISKASFREEVPKNKEAVVVEAEQAEEQGEDEEEEEEEEVEKPPKKKKTKVTAPAAAVEDDARSRKSSSTYRGVSLCTKDSRWQARIRIRKEVVYLGRFESEEDAARRYDDAAREHHGDKALLNFITPEDRALGRKCVFEQSGGKSARF